MSKSYSGPGMTSPSEVRRNRERYRRYPRRETISTDTVHILYRMYRFFYIKLNDECFIKVHFFPLDLLLESLETMEEEEDEEIFR